MTKSLLYVLTAICVLVGPSMALSDQCALVLPFMVFYGLALSCMYVIFVNCMACVWARGLLHPDNLHPEVFLHPGLFAS